MNKNFSLEVIRIGSDSQLVRIEADVTTFYNDFKDVFFLPKAVAELDMSVIVKSKEGHQLFSSQIDAQGIEPDVLMFSGENARLALNRAIENCLKILFENQAFLSALNALDSSPTDISGITPSSPTKKDEGKSNEVKPADRKLEKLKDLYDRNLITKEEYDSERKKILNEL